MSGVPSNRAGSSGRIGSPGFTMLELLVVITLLGVLTAIAIPSYSAYVTRGQRAAAKAALVQSAQFLERNYTAFGCYSQTSAPCGSASAVNMTVPAPFAPTDGSQISYALSVTFPDSQSYQLSAAPCGSGVTCPTGSNQTFNDSQCGTLTLDNTGLKGVTGGTDTSVDDCWGH